MSHTLEFRDLLDESFQELLLACLLTDRDFLVKAYAIPELPTYFTAGSYRHICEALFACWNEDRTMPQVDTVAVAASKAGEHLVEREALALLVRRLAQMGPLDKAFVRRELVYFVQRARAAVAVGQAFEDLRQFPIDELTRTLVDVERFPALFEDRGLVLARDWRLVLEPDPRRVFKTGFRGVDESMRGGARAGELVCILAPLKRGKSVMLSNFGRGLFQMGAHVAHITLEIRREDVLRSYCAALATTPEETVPVNHIEEYGEVIEAAVTGAQNYTQGSVTIQNFPSRKATVSMVEAYVDQLAQARGEPVVPIVDYAALLRGRDIEEWEELHEIMEDLRNMADRLRVPVFTANQTNAAGMRAKALGPQHQSKSTRAGFTVDYMFALNQSEEDYAAGRMLLVPVLNRNERSDRRIYLEIDAAGRRIREISEEKWMALSGNQVVEPRKRASTGLFD